MGDCSHTCGWEPAGGATRLLSAQLQAETLVASLPTPGWCIWG